MQPDGMTDQNNEKMELYMRLNDKVAVITGGGSGIGRATALLFSREGASVVVSDYNTEKGKETVLDIERSGGKGFFIEADVSQSKQVDALVSGALDAYGRSDILFNNAGILFFGTILETDEETWNRIMAVNLTGTFLCSRAVVPHMRKNGGGSIINMTSSTGAHDAAANSAAYVTSKGGVALLTKCMAIDHAKDNIRVNAIAPGPTDTSMLRDNLSEEQIHAFQDTFPMKRLGRPQELANTVLFLASGEASFITGAVISVDGGQTAQV
jgi:meso-butanediol dehydrogenase/(S,S)-butanediol dehydrogenase/diacetyl reductase